MSNLDQIYSDGTAKIIAIFVSLYKKDVESGLRIISRSDVAKKLLIDLYNKFIREKSLLPIEELQKDEKQELFDQCKNFEDPVSMCRMLHVLKTI